MARRPLGAAHTLAAPGPYLVPSDIVSSCPFAYKLSSTRKPSIPDHIFQKTSEAAAVTNSRSEGSEALPDTLPDRGIVTGGIYTTMPSFGVMRE